MITIAWYNIVGIVLIIALAYFLFKLFVEEEKKDVFVGLYDAVKYVVLIVVTVFLILIWGGIFWW